MKSSSSIPDLVKIQEALISEYSEMKERTSMQNVVFFLDSFIREHEEIISSAKSGRLKASSGKPALKHLEVTTHLKEPEKMDVNSLQSVLLHICKEEEAAMNQVKLIKGAGEEILPYVEWQERIHEEADNLYHRFIESAAL